MKEMTWLGRLMGGSALAVGLALAGCDGSSSKSLGEGFDFGPNNPSLYVAFGDSITAGTGLAAPGSDAYSVKLAGMLNKTVLNAGYPGASSGELVDRIHDILDDNKPGFLLILAGINDLIMGYGEDVAAINVRIMIQACTDNKTIPVIATLTPVFGGYAGHSSAVGRLNDKIRAISSELGVALVDLNEAFEDNLAYMQTDGLHPNETGHALMAITFYDVVQ
ncbi:MAG: SGNH/GDSL hydrolase family protein [Lentisphaerae bacterium]|nr:SGNH/GDSL hydrolase family protein [Lentisphaerota bacterium]